MISVYPLRNRAIPHAEGTQAWRSSFDRTPYYSFQLYNIGPLPTFHLHIISTICGAPMVGTASLLQINLGQDVLLSR